MGPRKEEGPESDYTEASLLDPALLPCRVMLRSMAVLGNVVMNLLGIQRVLCLGTCKS